MAADWLPMIHNRALHCIDKFILTSFFWHWSKVIDSTLELTVVSMRIQLVIFKAFFSGKTSDEAKYNIELISVTVFIFAWFTCDYLSLEQNSWPSAF